VQPYLFDAEGSSWIESWPTLESRSPITYLGMPLSLRNLTKVDLDPWLLKFGSKTAMWKGRLMAKSGRLVLLKSGLTALAIYMMTVHKLPAWVWKRLLQICRAWLWSGEEECSGGKCRVAWSLICRPKKFGGLGVLDLPRFGSALRLRWLWYAWRYPTRPWVNFQLPCDDKDRMLFAMATEVTVGDGRRAKFWHDRWLHGQCPKTIAPALFKISARKNRTVHEALLEETWLTDLVKGLNDQILPELTRLATLLDEVQLHEGQDDAICWRFTESLEYSARSAYLLQFEGSIPTENYNLIWRAWAPEKCRFFAWTAALGRILTADVLLRRGWENNYFCALCERNLETTTHLFWECPWSKQAWGRIAHLTSMPALQPQSWSNQTSIIGWMADCHSRAATEKKKGTLSLLHLVPWELWKERNRRTFQQEAMSLDGFVRRLREEITLWNLAGAGIPFDPG
jgi:hypothetical protein